jgi:hypothetical protein
VFTSEEARIINAHGHGTRYKKKIYKRLKKDEKLQ